MCLGLFACNKQQATHHRIEPALLAAFNYKMGSYWIYKDSLTGQVDSMYVSRWDSSIQQTPDDLTNYYDMVEFWLNIYDGNLNHSEFWWIQLHHNYFIFYQFINNFDGVESVLEVPPIAYPFTDTAILFQGDSCFINVVPTYSVNGNQYINVAQLNCNSVKTYTIAKYNDRFYLDSKIGIAKFVFNHESDSMRRIMELQRYSIVK